MNVDIRNFTLTDLALGQTDEISINVSTDNIDRFAELSGDYAPLHMDVSFAKKQGFSGRVAQGLLIGTFVSGFIGTRLPGRYGILQSIDIGFRRPLIPPDTIRLKGEIINISKSVGQVVIKVTVSDSKGELLAVANVKIIVKEK